MQTFLSSVFSPSTPVRAFSDEEADFLAPFIASAFAKATPDQRVGFRITRTGTPCGASGPYRRLHSFKLLPVVVLEYCG